MQSLVKKIAIVTLVVAAMLPTAAALAQQKMGDMKGMGANMAKKPAATTQTTHIATGVVKLLDAKAGVVTLAHDPVSSLNWPPMTMGFKVKDKALLAKLKEGQKKGFEFVQEDDGYLVTSVK